MRRLQGAGLADHPVVCVLPRAMKRHLHALHAGGAQPLCHRARDPLARRADAEIVGPDVRQLGQQLARVAAPDRIAAAEQECARPPGDGSGCVQNVTQR